jgi:hypothetical protein
MEDVPDAVPVGSVSVSSVLLIDKLSDKDSVESADV